MKNISIILINYNSWKDTIECINSIVQSKYNDFNVIIVDNCSSNDSAVQLEEYLSGKEKTINSVSYINKEKYLICEYKDGEFFNFNEKEFDKRIFLIKNNKNEGFSKGNNVGFRFSDKYLNNDYFWVLNNDVIIDENAMTELLNTSEKNNNLSFIGATILEYYNRDVIQCTCGGKYNIITTISKKENSGKKSSEILKLKENSNYISGCSIFGSKKIFKKVNFFSEDYFLYFEELDLMKKAKQKGIGKDWSQKAIIYHKEGNSIGSKNIKRKKSELSEYYSNISCLTYNKKFYPRLYKLIAFNRYILKLIKFLFFREYDLLRVMNRAFKDFFERK